MRTTSFRRTVATLLAAAVGAGTLVAGAAPVASAEPTDTTGGTLDWGVKASFRNYITGPIAHGSIEVRDPATRNADGTFRFAGATEGTGTADPDAGTAELSFAGEVYFAGHDMGAGPLLELTVTDPRVTVTSATDGVLVADVVSKSLDSGQLVTYDDVELADLDLTDHPLTFDGDTVSATGVPATLTAAGVPAFANFYAAGTALDPLTFTATLEEQQPVFEPSIEVFAADGSTPAAEAELTYGDTIVVRGSGFDPNGNVAPAGNRPPIPAGVPAGSYVVFGSFAETWRPSAGAPSSARTVGAQKWALAQAALDQVPAQYQDAIRAQWAEIGDDGTFTAELTLAKPTDRTTGEPVEWPANTTLGVYTYAAGGTTNADQELSVPLTVTEDSDPEPIDVTAATFEWGINLVSQYGSPAGGCSFFVAGVAGVADGTEASYQTQDGDVYLLKRLADGRATAVTAENRCYPIADDKINQRALFTGGTGRIEADGAGTISWTGAFTIYSYGGMVPWYVRDPRLTVDADGHGVITAEVGGFASSMEDPTVKEPLDPEQDVTILELDGVEVVDGALTGTPVYQGVDYFPLNDPADPASGRRETSAIPDEAKAANPNWGSWPTPIVDFHYRTGLSSYWHTSGLSADPNKPPLPVLLDLDGGVPEFVDVYPVTITEQPQWAQAVTGEDATFTVTAESDDALTYQWQRRAPGAADWQNVDGATSATLTLPGVTPADTGTYVRVIITNSTTSLTSDAAGVQVQDAAAPELWSSPLDVTTFEGYKAQFAADIAGWPRPTYQWQTSTDGGATWTDHGEAGIASSYLELTGVTADQDGLLVRAVGGNGRGADVVTEPAELTVLPAPSEPTLAFPEGAEFDPAADYIVLSAVGGGYPVPTSTVTLAVVEADVWAARDDTFDRETDTVTWSEMHSVNFTDGFFDAALYVEKGQLDPAKDYVLATFSTTPGDRSHDAEVAIPLTDGEPVFEPSIEVFAADGTTPVAEAELTYGDTIVVRGSGFDPNGNVAPEGNRPPIPAGVPAGAYVVFGSFADTWQPSAGAPSSSRTVGAQKWALAQAALDQVPAQYQDAIRAQWAEIEADGTFTAELTLAKPTDRTTGEAVEWPADTTLGVYTYAAGGTTNADQELSVPLTVTEEPAAPALTLSASADLDNAGSNTIEVTGSGFAPQRAIEVVQAVRVEGTDPSTWPAAAGSARVMTTAEGEFLVPAKLNAVTSRFVPYGGGDVYDCKVVECVLLATDFGTPGDRSQDAWAPIAFDDAERPEPSATLDATEFPAEGGATHVHGSGFIAGDHVLVVQTTARGDVSDPRELPRNPAGTSQLVPGEGDGAWALRLDGIAPTFTAQDGSTVDCREVECTVAVFPSGRADLTQSVSVPITFADDEPAGEGSLDWGVKESFRTYITGPIAHGSIEVRDPATRNQDGTFRFGEGTGSATELEFGGEVYFSGHDMGAGPLLELTITDPRVSVTSADAGVLVADVVSKSLDSGELVTYDDVEFATLDFTDHPVTVTDGVVAASGVPAALTAEGAGAFAGFYAAGIALDAVTFTVPIDDDPEPPAPSVTVSEVADLDPYADQITVTGSGFAPGDLAGGLRVGIGVVTGDGSVPALDPVETVTFEPVGGLLSFARAALGTFEVTLTTGQVEPGTTLAVYTSPVDAAADPAYTTQTPITFADVRTPQLTVTPADELAIGTEVRIDGTGFAPNRRISLAFTANAEQDPEYGWPTGWLQHEVVQAGADGTLSRTLVVAGTVTGSGVDCVTTACYLASFSSAQASDATPVDYRADRSQDVLVPVTFADDPGPQPEPAVTVTPDPVVQGEPVTFTGTGFEPGATVTAVVDRDEAPAGEGSLDWGVKESFRNYITGPIAHGSIEVRDPAVGNDDGTFRFGEGSGDETELAFGGEVYFSGHDMGAGPLLELTIADPRVSVDGSGGVLVADVVSKSLDSGELVTYDDVELAALDFTDHPVTVTDGVVAASDVPAALTADGVAAFADFYPAGTELDPVTFSVPVAAADAADVRATGVEAGAGTAGDDGTVEIGWTVPADLAAGGHTVDLVVEAESLASAAFTVEEADEEPHPDPEPAVTVDPESVRQGETVTFRGTDFGAEEDVEATIVVDAATEELTFENDHGQGVTVRSADGNPLVQRDGKLLVVDGGELEVTLTGLAPTSEENTPDAPAGFYLLTAIDNGPGEVATPAIGGADTTGESGTSRWITNFPYAGSEDIVVPIADGVAETSIALVAADEYADCDAGCVLYLRTDHRSAANRAFDLRVPLEFVSASELAEAAQAEPVTVSGTTDADGAVTLEWTVPADSPVGAATVTLTGADSERTASAPFTVTAAAPGGDDGSDDGSGEDGGDAGGSADGTDGGAEDGDGDLPDTGTDPLVILVAGLMLLAGGIAVALYDRRRRA